MASSSASPRAARPGGAAAAHRYLALLILLAGVIQFFLAGWGAFGGGSEIWDGHSGLGSLLTVLGLIALVLAYVARREALQPSAVLFGLLVLQQVLGVVGGDVAFIGAFHPVNGLLILAAAMLAAAGRPVRPGAHAAARA
jgi:hypothetical protein